MAGFVSCRFCYTTPLFVRAPWREIGLVQSTPSLMQEVNRLLVERTGTAVGTAPCVAEREANPLQGDDRVCRWHPSLSPDLPPMTRNRQHTRVPPPTPDTIRTHRYSVLRIMHRTLARSLSGWCPRPPLITDQRCQPADGLCTARTSPSAWIPISQAQQETRAQQTIDGRMWMSVRSGQRSRCRSRTAAGQSERPGGRRRPERQCPHTASPAWLRRSRAASPRAGRPSTRPEPP